MRDTDDKTLEELEAEAKHLREEVRKNELKREIAALRRQLGQMGDMEVKAPNSLEDVLILRTPYGALARTLF